MGYNGFMKITIRRSGGFAGTILNKTYEVETESLPHQSARKVECVMDAWPADAPREQPSRTRSGADMFKYEVTIEKPGGPISLIFDEASVPDSFKPVWSILRTRMKS